MSARSFARRGLSWSNAVDRMKADRMERAPIREERLRGKRSVTIDLSAWRGQSGKRYVVAVHGLDAAAGLTDVDVVIIGVRRDADGLARIVGCGHRGTVAEGTELARADGATEIHIHRLAESPDAREAIVEDLVGDDAI